MMTKADVKKARVRSEDVMADMERMVAKYATKLPPVVVQPLVPNPTTGTEEVMCVVVSDLQIGHTTPTFNSRTLRNRGKRLTQSVLKIANLHRQMYPIRKLVVFLNGDIVHHHRVGMTVNLDELEMTLLDQMYQVAIPLLSEVLLTWSTQFEEVEVVCCAGNHGSFGKDSANSFNADTLVYLTLRDRLGNQPNLKWAINPHAFWQRVRIKGWRFLAMHGDAIKMWQNLPWYGVTNRSMRLQGSLPGGRFDYLVLGHFHTFAMLDWNDTEIIMNASWVSDDMWVLKQLGMASHPRQVCFGVHPEHGVTWRYKIDLER